MTNEEGKVAFLKYHSDLGNIEGLLDEPAQYKELKELREAQDMLYAGGAISTEVFVAEIDSLDIRIKELWLDLVEIKHQMEVNSLIQRALKLSNCIEDSRTSILLRDLLDELGVD